MESNKKILVTGGCGFVGSHLVDRLVEMGKEVIVVDNLSTGTPINLNPRTKFYEMDICGTGIAELMFPEKPEMVFHLAAKTDARESMGKPLEYAQTNIFGSIKVVNAFIDAGLSKNSEFIFFSTGGVMYGEATVVPTPETHPAQPLCPYGWTKLSVENYLEYCRKIFGLNYVVLRPSNIYGPRQNFKSGSGAVAIFCDRLAAGKPIVINGDGKQTRDYVYVDDVVDAAILTMDVAAEGIYNIGTGRETDVNELLATIKKIMRSDANPIFGLQKPGEHRRGCLDCSRAKKEIDWRPKHRLEDGLCKTVDWCMRQSG